jgi:hypothetical protein
VVFEGIWGPNRANGVISVDDVSFHEGQCSSKYNWLWKKQKYLQHFEEVAFESNHKYCNIKLELWFRKQF